MKLEKDNKLGLGRGAFNPATRSNPDGNSLKLGLYIEALNVTFF